MDLTPFKLDIDELLDEFCEEKCTTLADMKRVWLAKKFSYIYEAKPTSNSAFFMQSLYAHSIGKLWVKDEHQHFNMLRTVRECVISDASYMASFGALSQRLGGLYCLYCLYETQPCKPCFKIYLSLGELKRLKELVIDAKENGIGVVPAVVKRMLEKTMFLFGFVDILGCSVTQRVEEIAKLQNKRARIAFDRLFANSQIESYLNMDLGAELELKTLKKMSTEYARAKELAMKEASPAAEVEDVLHINENEKTACDTVESIVEQWEAQKDDFYKQTGINRHNEIVPADAFNEIEQLLEE
ncbi:hypothetical protein ACMD2_08173 [Ananas comosus]|uniref:snRNA-activating protein complex subunit 1 n=1 Tax=Ananas comosus TaxID=4615 RepID=A0A199VP88_ANACO|nr:hypothetical protein ACMD2_08173 [Ananas comosus]